MAWSSHVFTVEMKIRLGLQESYELNPFTKQLDWKLESQSVYFKPTCSILIEDVFPESDTDLCKTPSTINQGNEWIEVAYCNWSISSKANRSKVTIKYRVDPGWIRHEAPSLAGLLDEDETKDVLFKIGDENIRAHKLIICWRVPAFKAMFSSGMQEAQTNCATIENTEPNAFRHLLQFVYSGEMPMEESIHDVVAVLILAEKYNIDALKEACVDILGIVDN